MVLIACGAAGRATQNLDILRLRNGFQKLVLVSRRFAGNICIVSQGVEESYLTVMLAKYSSHKSILLIQNNKRD